MNLPINFQVNNQRSGLFGYFIICLLSLVLNSSTEPASASGSIKMTSSSIQEGARIAKRYSGDGEDLSPALKWSAGPAKTKSYAVTCCDPDAPGGVWWHWIVFNIKPNTSEFGENVPKLAKLAQGVMQGRNDFGKTGYNGPSPPPGKLHHYVFTVYALDNELALSGNCSKEEFQKALQGHILDQGQITGTYQR